MYIIHNYCWKCKRFFIIFYANPFSSGKKRVILKLLNFSLIRIRACGAKRFAHVPRPTAEKPRAAVRLSAQGKTGNSFAFRV